MPKSTDRIVVPLSEPACVIALSPRFGVLVPTPSNALVAKINATPLDTSLGENRAMRHVVCTAAEAQELFAFYRLAADSYGLGGKRDERVQVCADAAANVEHALRKAGVQPQAN